MNYSKWGVSKFGLKTDPLVSYGSFQEIAIGDRVECKEAGCFNLFGKTKTYQGVVDGLETTKIYLVKLDSGETVPLKRNRLKLVSPTYQHI